MDYRRVIPCLDTKDGRLVKGIHFVDLTELGDPAEAAAAYSEAGADEIVVLDITATLEARQTRAETVGSVVEAATVPVAVGGGIGSLEDIQAMLDLGVSTVSMNSAAVKRPELVKEAADEFGSEKIVIAIDTKTNGEMPSGFEVVVSGGTKPAGIDAIEHVKQMEDFGAGQILPTSMDTDGVQTGYDIPMTRAMADAVDLPIIASGGAGALEHLVEVVEEAHADAVLVASIAHYGTFTIQQMKDYMAEHGIAVRK